MIDDRPAIDEPFHLLVDGVSEYAIFMLDPTGAVLTWNAGRDGSRATTQPRSSDATTRCSSATTTSPQTSPCNCSTTPRSTAKPSMRAGGVRKDGSQFWANAVITALFDAAGEVRGFAKITRDDTDRRAADVQARQVDVCLDHDRIALGLNDDVISRIFGVGLALEGLRSFSQDPRHNERINQAVDELDHVINDLRAIVLDF